MTDFYLKFTDEAAATAVLYHTETVRDYDRELTEEEQALGEDNFAIKHIEVANYANISTIGVIYEATPEDAGEDYAPAAIPGWHVNVRLVEGEDASALQPYQVNPATPLRVWG